MGTQSQNGSGVRKSWVSFLQQEGVELTFREGAAAFDIPLDNVS